MFSKEGFMPYQGHFQRSKFEHTREDPYLYIDTQIYKKYAPAQPYVISSKKKNVMANKVIDTSISRQY